MNVDVPRLDHGLGDTLEDGLMGDAAQRDGAGERPRVRLVAAEHGLEQVNDNQISEPRYRHVGQLLGGPGDIQGSADVGTSLVQQGQPLTGSVLLGDVEHPDPHCLRPAGLILQRGNGNRPGAFPGLTRYPAVGLPVRRLARVQHLPHITLQCAVLGTGQDTRQAPSAKLVFGEPEHLAHSVVDAQAKQVPVMDRLVPPSQEPSPSQVSEHNRPHSVCHSVTDRNEASRAECRENSAGDPALTRRWPPD